ncbi:MAG: DUF58 domain-containing protein [Microcoleaceae cyanobacterium]|jgi:uncharacterized protein (DUF58 family)
MLILAFRFYLFLLLGSAIALIFAIFFNLSLGIEIILIFDSILLGIAIFDGWRMKRDRIEIKRDIIPHLSIGRDNVIVLSITSKNQATEICIKDRYPLEFDVSSSQLETFIDKNSSQNITYTVNPKQRGEYQWGNIQIRQLSPWRLVWYDWQITANQTIKVYPDLIALKELSLRLTLENTGSLPKNRRLGMGTEFAELREYRLGDDPRFIDWKATARRSRPVVRILEPEKEQTVIILLDRGRLMTAQVQGLKRFDWGLNATLSLALAGLNRGDRVGIGIFDREVVTWIPPQRGQHQLSKLIERLTPLQPVLLEPDYVGAVTQLVNQQTRRALVVLITDIIDNTASTELLSALARLTPRYLPFCVTLRDTQIDQIAHPTNGSLTQVRQGEITQAYQQAVALDLLTQRQIAFGKLKQKGVLVLDAPANLISQKLVDQYLQLKARNLL